MDVAASGLARVLDLEIALDDMRDAARRRDVTIANLQEQLADERKRRHHLESLRRASLTRARKAETSTASASGNAPDASPSPLDSLPWTASTLLDSADSDCQHYTGLSPGRWPQPR